MLVYAPSAFGGLAEHVHYQARELARRGFRVELLCQPDFLKEGENAGYHRLAKLLTVRGRSLGARIGRAICAVINPYILAWHAARLRPEFVLLEANSEYYALAWFLPHWLLSKLGTIYLANFHDPVRAPTWPRWLHPLNLRLAYAPLAGGLIHAPAPREAYLPDRLIVKLAPFGTFEDLLERPPAFDLRARLSIPANAYVLLAFGHIADRKNLDLIIEALPALPGVHLVVAGNPVSATERGADFYLELAQSLGLSERVHFVTGFIPEADIPAFFEAADAVALTYERAFVSQSGVLQIAALFDKPVIASGGVGPLRDTADRFGLGVTIEPDSAAAIIKGVTQMRSAPEDRSDNFARYRTTTSWRANVDQMLQVVEEAKVARVRGPATETAGQSFVKD